MINNIENNTISETLAKKGLNTLNEIKNVEIIKQKKRTPKQKELLNFFNDLSDTFLTDETLESKSQEKDNENKNENENGNKNRNENKNEHDKTLIPSKDEKKKETENEDKSKNEN